MKWLEELTWGKSLRWGLVGATVIELITALFRFGFKLTSAQHTSGLARFTFGLRIHHGYIGLICLILIPFIRWENLEKALLIVGMALVLSDLAHHFVVLKMAVGSPEFDFYFPGYPLPAK